MWPGMVLAGGWVSIWTTEWPAARTDIQHLGRHASAPANRNRANPLRAVKCCINVQAITIITIILIAYTIQHASFIRYISALS